MFRMIFEKIFGTKNSRIIKNYQKLVNQINLLETKYESLTNEELKDCTIEFKNQIAHGKTLDDIMTDTFAIVREAAKRSLNQRHYDVQLMGGIALHQGKIAEMHTGEGKTLVATLAAYLNALSGKVHIVTVNDYLAKRDAEWMGRVYSVLGMTTGYIIPNMEDQEKKKAYECDIIYGTNSELGFDYLRDNMKTNINSMIQGSLDYAIIDEVDSILIDEARTPLVISGPTNQDCNFYVVADQIVKLLDNDCYDHDEKHKSVYLTDIGIEKAEVILKKKKLIQENSNLYNSENISILHCLNQSLKANIAFKKNKDYLVKDSKVIIIDEFTGRMMHKRRYSDGLHQALEAKEKVKIEPENQTLASISFQNYFRMYHRLSGMTGTASTESDEFHEIYGLEVISIPTNVPNIRQDSNDLIYRKRTDKMNAVIENIKECYQKKQPVLIGVVSVEKSEELSNLLQKIKIPHNVLNAKNHQKEAEIIDQAGCMGAVTIATNMAGRGTDIQLGGNPNSNPKNKDKILKEAEEIEKLGGLFIIGTERNESRRVDNQLRGRAGRQGSAGKSQFFLSLEDDLMRIFGGERLDSIMNTLGMSDNEAISHSWVTHSLDSAQKKIESYNYEIRKNLIQYDDVINEQRKSIYEQRNYVIANDNYEFVVNIIDDTLNKITNQYLSVEYMQEDSIKELNIKINELFGYEIPILKWVLQDELNITDKLKQIAKEKLEYLMNNNDLKKSELLFKEIIIHIIDQEWRQHLLHLDIIKKSSSLKAYANKNPLNEYKVDAFNLFSDLNDRINKLITHYILNIINNQIIGLSTKSNKNTLNSDSNLKNEDYSSQLQSNPEDNNKLHIVSRNALCSCNSGIKYKHCHGKI